MMKEFFIVMALLFFHKLGAGISNSVDNVNKYNYNIVNVNKQGFV